MSAIEQPKSPQAIYLKIFSNAILNWIDSCGRTSSNFAKVAADCTKKFTWCADIKITFQPWHPGVTIVHTGRNLIEVTWPTTAVHLHHKDKALVIQFPQRRNHVLR